MDDKTKSSDSSSPKLDVQLNSDQEVTGYQGWKTLLVLFATMTALAMVAYLIKSSRTTLSEDLYTQYYPTYISSNSTDINTHNPDPCKEPHRLMEVEDYSSAKTLWLELIKESASCAYKAQWFLGLLHLKQNEVQEALTYFNWLEVDNNPNNTYRNQAIELIKNSKDLFK